MDPFLDNPTKITMSSAPADLVIERVDDMVNDFDLEDAEDIRDFLAGAGFDPYWTADNTITSENCIRRILSATTLTRYCVSWLVT